MWSNNYLRFQYFKSHKRQIGIRDRGEQCPKKRNIKSLFLLLLLLFCEFSLVFSFI